ncbi:hypothetical protein ACWD4G_04585 [Streptomyces sp. NPDC002643]
MEPVSVALLAALAGGAGGELGRQSWASLSELVRRPFRRGQEGAHVPAISSGEAELTTLTRAPADPAHAQALSTALAVRAALDADFHTGLQQWQEQAKLVRTGDGAVNNTISGGTYNAPVVMGRDISQTTITNGPPPAAPGGGAGPTHG